MTHKAILAYVPVVQRGYLDLINLHSDAQEIYLWGDNLISLEPSLRKEIRALNPDQARAALQSITGRNDIVVAGTGDLAHIAKSANPLVLPDDAISHRLVNGALLSMGLKDHLFEPVFLRWDSKSATAQNSVIPDAQIAKTDMQFLVDLASYEANQSSDWWRRVGAVLFDRRGCVYFSAHNRHLPTDYTPYIEGDPRAAFSKGVNIEVSTAVHAEVEALGWAAAHGVRTSGLKLLVTTFPCPNCAKLIAACGISELLYLEGYSMVDGERVLRDAGVRIVHVV